MPDAPSTRDGVRLRIVAVAARLLQEHGAAAVTTRGVADAAGVQAPTIYRLFGDKDGLMEAVAEHVMATFVSAKAETVKAASVANVDPLQELRAGWQTQMDFGLANPTLFRLLSNPDRVPHSPAARSGKQVLETRVHRIALVGRLRVSEQRAVDLIQAAGIGTIQTLLLTPPNQRDPGLADAMFDAVLEQILTNTPSPAQPQPIAMVVAVRAITPRLDTLTHSERQLLTEWLDRVINSFQPSPPARLAQ